MVKMVFKLYHKCLMAGLCLVALSAAQNLTNEFVLGAFKGPYLTGTNGSTYNHDENIRRVQEYKAANMNLYCFDDEYATNYAAQLEAVNCASAVGGLKVQLWTNDITASNVMVPLKTHLDTIVARRFLSLWGPNDPSSTWWSTLTNRQRNTILSYQLTDEPTGASIQNTIQWINYLQPLDPKMIFHVNLIQRSQNYTQGLTWSSYINDYVKLFSSNSNCKLLSHDYYPLAIDGSFTPNFCTTTCLFEYYTHLKTYATICKETSYQKPFWVYPCSAPITSVASGAPDLDTRPLGMRYSAYAPLIYGCKGILWFTYDTQGGYHFPAAVNYANQNPGMTTGVNPSIYNEMKNINLRIKNMGPTLMNLDWDATVHGTSTDESTESGLPVITSSTPVVCNLECSDPLHIAIGILHGKNGLAGRNFLAVFNKSRNGSTLVPRIEVYGQVKAYRHLKTVDAWEWLPTTYNPSSNRSRIAVDVPSCEMELIRLEPSTTGLGAVCVARGYKHTLAIREDGSLYAWGDNSTGQLGLGNQTTYYTPQRVGTATNWVSVAAAGSTSAVGGFSVALNSKGEIWTWGANSLGQLGNGAYQDLRVPALVSGNWIAISAHALNVLAQASDGSLWGWGYNGDGQLGNGTTSNSNVPVAVYFGSQDWVHFDAGSNHSVGILLDGTLWCWGNNSHGENANLYNSYNLDPIQEYTYASDWLYASAGHDHTLGLKNNRTLYAWGSNQWGQLGTAATVGSTFNWFPTEINSVPDNWDKIGTSVGSSFGLKQDGTVWSWGPNSSGELGDGTTTNRSTATQEKTKASDWALLSTGYEYVAGAIKQNGLCYGWGANSVGEVGTGSTSTYITTPTQSIFCPKLPKVKILTPTANENFNKPAKDTLISEASGNINYVEYFNGSTSLGKTYSTSTPPYGIIQSNPAIGTYQIKAVAYDKMGSSYTSPVTTFTIGSLTIPTPVTSPSSVTLTTEGTLDWTHWGRTSATDYNHKNTTSQIGNFKKIGSGTVTTFTGTTTNFIWTDGVSTSPAVANSSSKNYVRVSGIGNGFRLTVQATNTARTLIVYLAVSKAQGQGVAYLSDKSAPFVCNNNSFTNSSVISYYKVTVNFTAASTGKTINFDWTMLNDLSGNNTGFVGLAAATLK
jgi:alpha-tubulin suppressor-like RCC1 family protein